MRIITWIRGRGGARTTRDLQRANVTGITSRGEAQEAFSEIENRGWGRIEHVSNAHGRESLRIILFAPTPDNTTRS